MAARKDLMEDARTRDRSVSTAAILALVRQPPCTGRDRCDEACAAAHACVTTATANPTRVGGQFYDDLVAGAGPNPPPVLGLVLNQHGACRAYNNAQWRLY